MPLASASLDCRAGGDERARRVEASVPRRIQQRRQGAGNEVTRPAFRQPAAHDADAVAEAGHRIGQHPGRRLPGPRLCVDVGVALDEELRTTAGRFSRTATISAVC